MQRGCTKCGIVKCLETEFQIAAGYADGHRRQCKRCIYEYQKRYAKTAIGRAKALERQKSPELKAYKAAWHKLNKARTLAKNLERRKTDVVFKLRTGLRTRLNIAIRNKQKAGSAVKDLGCSIAEFRNYLEKLWQPGMSWDNWKINGWHIDHIKPLSSFDLTDPEQFKKACHYTNMQPLWAHDNWVKNRKVL